jgi:hypothetical protein
MKVSEWGMGAFNVCLFSESTHKNMKILWNKLKCFLGFHDWEWKRTDIRNSLGEVCGWAEGNICKRCNKKE